MVWGEREGGRGGELYCPCGRAGERGTLANPPEILRG